MHCVISAGSENPGQLDHPNITKVYDFGEFDAGLLQPYLVMAYRDGQTLKTWLTEKGPLLLEQTLSILQQISAALDHAHSQHIIHGDLKPATYFLLRTGMHLLVTSESLN